MKNYYFLLLLATTLMILSCGPNKADLELQRIKDSLRIVEQVAKELKGKPAEANATQAAQQVKVAAPRPLPAGTMRTLRGRNGGKVTMEIDIRSFYGRESYIRGAWLNLQPLVTPELVYDNGNGNFKYNISLQEYGDGMETGVYYATFTSSNNGHQLSLDGEFINSKGRSYPAHLTASY